MARRPTTRPSHIRSVPPAYETPFSERSLAIIRYLRIGMSAGAVARHLGEVKSRVRVVRLRAERRGLLSRPAEFAP
jgi:transposase